MTVSADLEPPKEKTGSRVGSGVGTRLGRRARQKSTKSCGTSLSIHEVLGAHDPYYCPCLGLWHDFFSLGNLPDMANMLGDCVLTPLLTAPYTETGV